MRSGGVKAPFIARAVLLTGVVLAPQATRVDLAGSAPRWTIAEDLRIPSEGDRYLLTEVFDLQVGQHGVIIIGDAQERRLLAFDSAGPFQRSLGKRGYGPGEFQSPKAMGWLGDTLWVTDEAQLRVSHFDLERGHLATVRISGPAIPPGLPRPPNYLLADGSVAIELQVGSRQLAKTQEVTEIPVLRLSRQGVILDTLARLPLGYRVVYVPVGRRELYSAHPLPMIPFWKASPTGDFLVFVDLPSVRSGAHGTIRIAFRKPSGGALRAVEFPFSPQDLSRAVRDSVIESLANGLSKVLPEHPPVPALRSTLKSHIPFPRFRPPVTGLVVGRDSTVWLRREETGGATVRWDVLDWFGNLVGSCEIPTALTVFQAQRTAFWGVIPDEDGAPDVVRYRVIAEPETN